MTGAALGAPRRLTGAEGGVLVAVLGVAVALRGATTVGFVVVLAAAALGSGWRPARPSAAALGWGAVGAVLLVAGPLGRALELLPAATGGGPVPGRGWPGFAPWAVAVAVVVAGEEAFLRGALWRSLDRTWGPAAALLGSTAGFALVHLPVYGWRALPLDTVVGLVLGGLRMVTGSVAAPAAAHVVADWAGWWLA